MFSDLSAPPRFNGTMWSSTYPGQAPVFFPVAGQGCWRWKARRAAGSRLIRPSDSRYHGIHIAVRGACGYRLPIRRSVETELPLSTKSFVELYMKLYMNRRQNRLIGANLDLAFSCVRNWMPNAAKLLKGL